MPNIEPRIMQRWKDHFEFLKPQKKEPKSHSCYYRFDGPMPELAQTESLTGDLSSPRPFLVSTGQGVG